MRVILGALVAVLLATTATAQTTIEQRNQWRRQAAQFEAAAAGLRKAAECDMPDFPTGWTRRQLVTPAATSATAIDKALLAVRIDANSALSSGALANGHDILFTAPDGTTVLESYRLNYAAGSGDYLVYYDGYETGDTFYMNYGNTDASDQSNSSVFTLAKVSYLLDFSRDPSGGLVDLVSGTTGAKTGTVEQDTGQVFGGYVLGTGDRFTFSGLGYVAQPRTIVLRGNWSAVTGRAFEHSSTTFPVALTSSGQFVFYPSYGFPFTLLPISTDTNYHLGASVGSSGTGNLSWYSQGSQVGQSQVGDDAGVYGDLTVGSVSGTTPGVYSWLAVFSEAKDSAWWAFDATNDGTASFSEEEEAPTPVTEPSVDSLRRLNSAQGLADARRLVVSPPELE